MEKTQRLGQTGVRRAHGQFDSAAHQQTCKCIDETFSVPCVQQDWERQP